MPVEVAVQTDAIRCRGKLIDLMKWVVLFLIGVCVVFERCSFSLAPLDEMECMHVPVLDQNSTSILSKYYNIINSKSN